MWHNLWDADHRPVSSVNLTGSPARTGRICAESYFRLLGDEGRPCRTAGDDHHAISDRPIVELESGRTSSRYSGTMLWWPTIGLDEDGGVLARPAKPRTSACREVCANLWPWCSDWLSSADELTGPLDASSVGRHLWIASVELHTNELEVLTWSLIELLEVDDLAKNWRTLKVFWACN